MRLIGESMRDLSLVAQVLHNTPPLQVMGPRDHATDSAMSEGIAATLDQHRRRDTAGVAIVMPLSGLPALPLDYRSLHLGSAPLEAERLSVERPTVSEAEHPPGPG